jgi:hypothetical protein
MKHVQFAAMGCGIAERLLMCGVQTSRHLHGHICNAELIDMCVDMFSLQNIMDVEKILPGTLWSVYYICTIFVITFYRLISRMHIT